ncbi:uncharacterized protein PpBr36_09796 [Pyricularia pennisetigena]|uniref:uncharacterized protein n=1 Tax=Pyricularia pennisetigena TaxID=1578925 RepID=UPI00114E8BBC|nr:uncharacterized protein PpBr36_09796 [Pyricularia pennisetigena]TLS22360.1 hypothetical protein PpBr36_09796 [Pyricularia pennisetigena]
MHFLSAVACLFVALACALPSHQGALNLSLPSQSSPASSAPAGGRDGIPPQTDVGTMVNVTTDNNSTAVVSPTSNHKALQCEPDPCIEACRLAFNIITLGLSCCKLLCSRPPHLSSSSFLPCSH